MAQRVITDADQGKRVVDVDGETVGIVTGVRNGRAYVDLDPGIGERILSKLGWDEIDADDYPLDPETIETITDDEIQLRREL